MLVLLLLLLGLLADSLQLVERQIGGHSIGCHQVAAKLRRDHRRGRAGCSGAKVHQAGWHQLQIKEARLRGEDHLGRRRKEVKAAGAAIGSDVPGDHGHQLGDGVRGLEERLQHQTVGVKENTNDRLRVLGTLSLQALLTKLLRLQHRLNGGAAGPVDETIEKVLVKKSLITKSDILFSFQLLQQCLQVADSVLVKIIRLLLLNKGGRLGNRVQYLLVIAAELQKRKEFSSRTDNLMRFLTYLTSFNESAFTVVVMIGPLEEGALPLFFLASSFIALNCSKSDFP